MNKARTWKATIPAIACTLFALLMGGCATGETLGNGGVRATGIETFSGTIEAIDNGCFADGECSVVVAGRKVVTLRGWSQATWGVRDPELAVGDRVDVRCRVTDEACTLEGDAGSFVRKAE